MSIAMIVCGMLIWLDTASSRHFTLDNQDPIPARFFDWLARAVDRTSLARLPQNRTPVAFPLC